MTDPRSDTTRGVLLLVFGALLSLPTAASAKHAAAGNCKHSHEDSKDKNSLSRCGTTGGGPLLGDACEVATKPGTCVHVTRGCQCRTKTLDFQLALLNSVHQSLETAATFSSVLQVPPGAEGGAASTPKPELTQLACAQMAVLAAAIVFDSNALFGYGLIRYNDPKLLYRLDEVIYWFPFVHAYAISCALGNAGLFPALRAGFIELKLGVVNNPNFNLQQVETPADEVPPEE